MASAVVVGGHPCWALEAAEAAPTSLALEVEVVEGDHPGQGLGAEAAEGSLPLRVVEVRLACLEEVAGEPDFAMEEAEADLAQEQHCSCQVLLGAKQEGLRLLAGDSEEVEGRVRDSVVEAAQMIFARL
jgi:hypothetical protein